MWPTSPCRAVNSSWRTILSSSLISSGMKLSTPPRKMADGCCATWFATSSPRMSSSSPVVWAKGSARSTQETQAWRDGHSTRSKSAASEVHSQEKSVHSVITLRFSTWVCCGSKVTWVDYLCSHSEAIFFTALFLSAATVFVMFCARNGRKKRSKAGSVQCLFGREHSR